jgi:hypothetical protein
MNFPIFKTFVPIIGTTLSDCEADTQKLTMINKKEDKTWIHRPYLIGEEPPLLPNIDEILNPPCLYYPKRKIQDTHPQNSHQSPSYPKHSWKVHLGLQTSL